MFRWWWSLIRDQSVTDVWIDRFDYRLQQERAHEEENVRKFNSSDDRWTKIQTVKDRFKTQSQDVGCSLFIHLEDLYVSTCRTVFASLQCVHVVLYL